MFGQRPVTIYDEGKDYLHFKSDDEYGLRDKSGT